MLSLARFDTESGGTEAAVGLESVVTESARSPTETGRSLHCVCQELVFNTKGLLTVSDKLLLRPEGVTTESGRIFH